MPSPANEQPILILGAGINGAAAARELALCGLPVVVVDRNDLAFGATGYSSRLIHGGLRYLEYREFGLVRESLAERARLLEIAPHLVRPLRLFIPARSRFGGFMQAAGKFLGLPLGGKTPEPRGRELVRMGLLLYDLLAWGSLTSGLGPRSAHEREDPVAPHLQPSAGSWLLSYSDAQIAFPERMVVELLLDAQALAAERGNRFELHTYTDVRLDGAVARLSSPKGETFLTPSLVINATGAWVDEALARLPASSPRLMGGTKGSHFFTWNRELVAALGGQAIYAEAADGRPVFVLPFGEGTLVGTTDLPFEGDPADAVATEEELEYLLKLVNGLVAGVKLSRDDIAAHYCGVRPLPYVSANSPAGITRRHQLVWNSGAAVPLVSLVGGKLTTCRSLAEETATAVLARFGQKPKVNSRDRPLPGAMQPYASASPSALQQTTARLLFAAQTGPLDLSQTEILRSLIRGEWVSTLGDLVERRLMLHLRPGRTRPVLEQLAGLLVETGAIPAHSAPAQIDACAARLSAHFGLRL